jgi:hypothetical protein
MARCCILYSLSALARAQIDVLGTLLICGLYSFLWQVSAVANVHMGLASGVLLPHVLTFMAQGDKARACTGEKET